MPVGQKTLVEDKKKKEAEFSLSRDLRLKDDAKIARIRFISDIDTFFWAYFHLVLTMTRLGKKYQKMYYCMVQDNKECPFDTNKDTMAVKKKLFFWVYVYGIYHLNQDAEGKWQKVEYEGDQYYVEPVNAFKLLVTGPGQNNTIESKFDKWGKKFKTLTDRDYNWAREGSTMKDTVYDLNPCDEGKTLLSEEISRQIAELTPLDAVIDAMKPPVGLVIKPAANGEGVEASSEDQSADGSDIF
jgi:hypothetical protein